MGEVVRFPTKLDGTTEFDGGNGGDIEIVVRVVVIGEPELEPEPEPEPEPKSSNFWWFVGGALLGWSLF